jgi:hypothetical protein
LVLCVLQLGRNSSKTSSKYPHFPRLHTITPINCCCAGQCAAKRQRTGKDAGASGKRHASNENVCCPCVSREASVTTCSYVKELEATVAWLKGPDYKPGAISASASALRLSVQSGSFSNLFTGAEPPIKLSRPACLESGGSGGEGDSMVERASQQVKFGLCFFLFFVVLFFNSLQLASAAASSNVVGGQNLFQIYISFFSNIYIYISFFQMHIFLLVILAQSWRRSSPSLKLHWRGRRNWKRKTRQSQRCHCHCCYC